MTIISHFRSHACLGAVFCMLGLAGSESASAQVNCNVLPHGPQRTNCYGQQSQIYRQLSQQLLRHRTAAVPEPRAGRAGAQAHAADRRLRGAGVECAEISV
jgi:hypothetical protein